MMIYGLTRKQCGVIFKAWKNGEIKATEKMIKWLYDIIQDSSVLANSSEAEYRITMKSCLEHIFDGELEEASSSFENAFCRWNASHQSCMDFR